MAGAKRTNTKPGMGAARSSRPPKKSKQPPPITVPSIKMPRVEDLGERAPDSRGTLKRAPSSDKEVRAQNVRTPSSRVVPGVVPVATPNARVGKDKKIEPADAFLLSRIDGQLKVEDLADLTGMSERDVIASLRRLAKAGLVTIA
jgi:hypothetical protein